MAIVRLWSLAGTIAVIGLVYLLVENIYRRYYGFYGISPRFSGRCCSFFSLV